MERETAYFSIVVEFCYEEGPAALALPLPQALLVQSYTSMIESIITSSISIWLNSASLHTKPKLQRTVQCAEKIIGCRLSAPRPRLPLGLGLGLLLSYY